MKTRRRLVGICLFLLLTPFSQTTLALTPTLIAHYPLKIHANDSTGNNAPMTLINAPFQEGGIYCNGNYLVGDSDSCHAVTPPILNFNFDSFSICAKFKVSGNPAQKPVFVCGHGYRWIGYYLNANGTVALKYNNNNMVQSNVTYAPDTWYEATLSYSDSVGKLYLDDSLAVSHKFEIIHGNENDIGITDFSFGLAFKGIFSDLRVYVGEVTRLTNQPSISAVTSFKLFQNYPNPFNPATTLFFEISVRSRITLEIYDLLGQEVKTLIDRIEDQGVHHIVWDGTDNLGQQVCSGVYLCRLSSGDQTDVTKMLFLR